MAPWGWQIESPASLLGDYQALPIWQSVRVEAFRHLSDLVMGADSSIVVDFRLNPCWHSDICHARGFGLSGPITHIFNYMRKELIVRKIYNNEYGMLFMIIGLLMAIAGGVLAFLWLPRGGAFIVIIGWIIGAAGLVVHFATNANDIFGGK